MIKILCLSIWYPLSMSRYFERAMLRNRNIELITTGPFTGPWIPWMGGMTLPEKYAKSPDIPLPYPPNVERVSYELVKSKLPAGWKPDIILSIDAGINWVNKPHEGFVATIGTDPHALNYDHQRKISDKFFNMQRCYSEPDDYYLPYAYDPTVHYMESDTHPVYLDNGKVGTGMNLPIRDKDAILIGMPYTHVPRALWIEELRKHGVSVIAENGPIFDEYRELANKAKIGLNWSSERDLNARFFETPAFGLPMVSNIVPDAHMFLEEGRDYLGFTTLDEAIEKVIYLKNNQSAAARLALNGYQKIKDHTYDTRVKQLVKECLDEWV